jgi:hypothetical protein
MQYQQHIKRALLQRYLVSRFASLRNPSLYTGRKGKRQNANNMSNATTLFEKNY